MLDPLAFSGCVAASVAGLLVALHARLLAPGLDGPSLASLIGLATAGTFVVYALDRVRGAAADSKTWPDRAAFAQRHRGVLEGAIGAAAVGALGCAALQPPPVWGVCAGVAALGLWHRRLKTRPAFKIGYLTIAWWSVVVGLPAVHMGADLQEGRLATVGIASALALLGNLVGSNASPDRTAVLHLARVAAGAGVLVALLGEPGARPLAWVPAMQLLALWPAEPGERARLWRVDGSLAVGALLALATLAAR